MNLLQALLQIYKCHSLCQALIGCEFDKNLLTHQLEIDST